MRCPASVAASPPPVPGAFVLNYVTKGAGASAATPSVGSPTGARPQHAPRRGELRRRVDDGGDPLADIEAERAAPTVAELIERFEQEHLPRKRESTAEDYRRMLRVWVRPHFGAHMKVADVVFEDIDRLHRKITRAGYRVPRQRRHSR